MSTDETELGARVQQCLAPLKLGASVEPYVHAEVLATLGAWWSQEVDRSEQKGSATLLGYRLATAGLSATSALRVLNATSELAGASHARLTFTELTIEGYVRGREQHAVEQLQDEAAKAITPVRLADRAYALLISGVHDADVLADAVDALGRVMLDENSAWAVVDFSQIAQPSQQRAKSLFGAQQVASMLGAQCIFVGVDSAWTDAALEANIDLDPLRCEPTLADAVAVVAGQGGLAQAVRRLVK